MVNVPPCTGVGPQCHGLDVTLRCAGLEGGPESADHEATWLLGHTERIDFGPLVRHGAELRCAAYLAVPCRFAEVTGPSVHCRAHGFAGPAPAPERTPAARRLGGDRFAMVQNGTLALVDLKQPTVGLPVLEGDNPCATAQCRTADHKIGAACCRDLQISILCGPEETTLESLVRARKSPYLCKIDREGPDSLGAEAISACSFLGEDGITCGLHGRYRGDHRSAKPDLCFDWPKPGDVYHKGCVFRPMEPTKRLTNNDL